MFQLDQRQHRRQALSTLGGLGIGACASVFAPLVRAQSPGTRPVRLILPLSVGSGVDTLMRVASPALAAALGQPVVIDNQPGAGGLIGANAIAKAAPDGFTLGVVSNNHVIFPSVVKSVPFDPVNDFTAIAVMGTTMFVLLVNPKVQAANARELMALLKDKPGALNYGSTGNGTIVHLAVEMFLDLAGVKARHIPYKGAAPMLADLVSGQIEFGMLALPSVQSHLKSGLLRAIGSPSTARGAAAPDIPTFVEQGLPNYIVEGWFAVVGPKNLPAADLARIHGALAKAFANQDVKDTITKQGITIAMSSPEAATAYLKTELVKYGDLAKKAGLQPE